MLWERKQGSETGGRKKQKGGEKEKREKETGREKLKENMRKQL